MEETCSYCTTSEHACCKLQTKFFSPTKKSKTTIWIFDVKFSNFSLQPVLYLSYHRWHRFPFYFAFQNKTIRTQACERRFFFLFYKLVFRLRYMQTAEALHRHQPTPVPYRSFLHFYFLETFFLTQGFSFFFIGKRSTRRNTYLVPIVTPDVTSHEGESATNEDSAL